MKKIFAVYGTLKRKYSNNRYLGNAKFLGEYKTEPKYTLFDGGFPIVERGGNTSVHIELFETDSPAAIHNVNSLEGCTGVKGHPDNWYDIDHVETPFGIADMFVMDKGEGRRSQVVESGLWERRY